MSRRPDLKGMTHRTTEILVRGIVQGVGFRPFVFRLAKDLNLCGHISNTPAGVVIRLAGREQDIALFIRRTREESPPLARIERLEIRHDCLNIPETDFKIAETDKSGQISTQISPDTATCSSCKAEIMDSRDRRFSYAFTNCTDCGPRYTIIQKLPYDRVNTTMKVFKMCKKCIDEYRDPADRRFHAQPNACPECGPHLWWRDEAGVVKDNAIDRAAFFLKKGGIIAVKGLGGFHIAASAFNDQPARFLRLRKNRPFKPFAVMVKDLDTACRFCVIPQAAAELLTSPASPIVLVPLRPGAGFSPLIAPGLNQVGIILPYTPLHHLLFAKEACPEALIMTSGNPRGEPLCTRNGQAVERLGGFVDGYLLHNREIHSGVDDSVVRIINDKVSFIRRSRGYAPAPVMVDGIRASGIAVGAELKNTFCLIRGKEVFLSQHIGNLTNLSCLQFFEKNIGHLQKLLEIRPEFVAADMHPDYLSTRFAMDTGLPVFQVQHHFAHAASVMAEHDIRDKVLALVLDGAGYGPDRTVWGGEILKCTPLGFKRLGNLRPFLLPGADMAARQPWRTALALIYTAGLTDKDLPLLFRQGTDRQKRQAIFQLMNKRINCPATTSCGRLFDAVSALAGLCYENTFEGQGAMMLEASCLEALDDSGIIDSPEFVHFMNEKNPWIHGKNNLYQVSWDRCLQHILYLMQQGARAGDVAMVFHAFLVAAFGKLLVRLSQETGISKIVLGGGCMQNRVLVEGLFSFLSGQGLRVYFNCMVPANDGGICLGQALIGSNLYEASRCA